MEDYLQQLNDAQRAAVEYIDGPELVIAGAGSGKTRVLTYKIVHLLAHGYEPWRILALTFTNKAAREMRERITALVGEKTASRLWMGTFHSIFAKILRINADKLGYKSDYTIYDASDSKALIKSIIKDMQLDDKKYKPSVVQNEISMAKNSLMSPKAYAADRAIYEANRRAGRPLLHEVYEAYCRRCRVADAMDFDDLLYNTNVLLRDNPDVKRHYQEFFRFILVDEYQDTNFAQHLIVSQLAADDGGCNRLCVVGDDAQSIYSFRGANIRNILNLRKSYNDLQIFKLEQNYRSTGNIIDAANTLIAKNTQQIPKHVYTVDGPGDRLELMRCYSEYEEARNVAGVITRRHASTGDSYEEFAILYRTNAQSRVLEEALRKFNIPYRIYGGLSFYNRKEIKDATSYFRLSVNPDDDEALRRVINYPTRGIGDTTVGKLSRAAMEHNVSLWRVLNDPERYDVSINKGTANKLAAFAQLISDFNDMNLRGTDAATIATRIIDRTHLLSMLVSDNTPESISKIENLQELLNGVRDFVDTHREQDEESSVTMSDFLAEVSLATDQDREDDTEMESVTLMTVHASKGLEFGNVIIVGAEEELFPSAMAGDSPMNIEEERRLMYVAITRAKRYCMISYAASRMRNGQTMTCRPSRFIGDISSKYYRQINGNDADRYVNPVANYRSSFHSSSPYHTPSAMLSDDMASRIERIRSSSVTWRPAAPAAATADTAELTPDSFVRHDAAELAEGMEIMHSRFGRGVIIAIDTEHTDPRINVRFAHGEVKTLLLKYARFVIINQ